MPPTLQSRISAFESLAGGSSSHDALNASPPSSPKPSTSSVSSTNSTSLIDAPPSAATAGSLSPAADSSLSSLAAKQFSPSPSPPNLGRKTSLIDLADWITDDDPVLIAPPMKPSVPTLKPKPLIVKRTSMNNVRDSKTPTQKAFNSRSKAPAQGLLISLESPPNSRRTSAVGKPPPPLPPRKSPSYNSLRSIASSSSSPGTTPGLNGAFLYPPRRTDSLSVDPPHAYPPSPRDGESRSPTKHNTASSISSFHSVSLSSDTDPSTPNSLSNFIATYPGDHVSEDSLSITESYEDVSASSLASPSTERMVALDFENARARRNTTVPPQLPKRPTSTSSGLSTPPSARTSMRSPPPLPPSRSSQTIRASGSVTPRSIPGSPIGQPSHSHFVTPIPTTYAVRKPPPPPPSRASDRSSVQSTFSISSASNQSHRALSRTNTITSISSTASSPRVLKQRPTPVPTAARKRYEAVFNGNIIQRRRAEKRQRKLALMKLHGGEEKKNNGLLSPRESRGRRAVGWRGLSIDLITGDPSTVAQQLQQQHLDKQKVIEEDDEDVDEFVGRDERLEAAIVKVIWRRSKLDKRRLAEIWNECDPQQIGSLDLDNFVKGMWRIDEELRRTQLERLKSASTASLASIVSKHGSLSRQPSLLGVNRQAAPSSFRPVPPRTLLR